LGPNGAESRARFRGITERLATAWQTPAFDEDKARRPAVLRNARNPGNSDSPQDARIVCSADISEDAFCAIDTLAWDESR
jgi:hypothetical protein